MISPLLSLNHQQKVIFRMSLNPETIIRKVELGTSRLNQRIMALNAMCDEVLRGGSLGSKLTLAIRN